MDARTGRDLKKTIFLVDDHPIVRHGLTQLIDQQSDLRVCGDAEDVGGAVDGIATKSPDVVILDLSLKTESGMDLIKILKERFPDLPILVLSMYDESLYAERALRAGARGYIMKEKMTDNVISGIRQVLMGRVYVSDEMKDKILHALSRDAFDQTSSLLDALSDRELQVFELLGRGLGTAEIAEELHMSSKTVHSYRARMKAKLHLEKSADLLRLAFQHVEGGKG